MVTFERDINGISERALTLFVSKARRAVGLRCEVDVIVTTNRRMQQLNKQFRRKDKPTDVLSFPAGPTLPLGRVGHPIAGEIAISGAIAKQNGRLLGHGTLSELKILVLHGVLHLAGQDHESDEGQMARREHTLRRELGLPDGLIERAILIPPNTSKSIGVPRPAQNARGTRDDKSLSASARSRR